MRGILFSYTPESHDVYHESWFIYRYVRDYFYSIKNYLIAFNYNNLDIYHILLITKVLLY